MATMAAPRHRFPDEILMIESSVASSSPVSCRLPLVGGALLLLAACGDGGGELAAPGTPDGGSGDVAALVRAYHDVVVADPRFDECWQGAPAAPGRCLRGPRSGSGLGDAVHEWIRTELSAIPELTHVQRQPFNFPRYRVRTVGLEADLGDGVEAVSAFPWFGQGVTPAEGLRAPLARVGLPLIGNPDVDGRVALMRFSRQFNADAADTHETLRAAEASGALAAVVTFDAPGNLIAAHNYDIQYPLAEMPTVIVGRQDFNRLATAASRGEEARLTLTADAVTGVVDNSIALLPGQDPRLLIIGTPMNTWVGGGGERAPGAAITVALARHLAARARNEGPLPYSVMFVATGGHEIYGYGLERALNCVNPDGVLAYIHLGAGLVSRGYLEVLGNVVPLPGPSQTRALVMSENAVLEALVDQAFRVSELGLFFRFAAGQAAPGEAEVAYNLGIPMMSLTGANPFHHTPEDTTEQVLFDLLPDMFAAYRQLVDSLMETPFETLKGANGATTGDPARNRGYACAGPISGLDPALQRAP
jgi:hypothetical protein